MDSTTKLVERLQVEIELLSEQADVLRDVSALLQQHNIGEIGALLDRYADLGTELAKLRAGVSDRLS